MQIKKGFTLVEVLGVVGIIGILMAVTYVGLNKVFQNNNIDLCENEIRDIASGFENYIIDYGNIQINNDDSYENEINNIMQLLNKKYLPCQIEIEGIADDKKSVTLVTKSKKDPWKNKYHIHIYTYDGQDKDSVPGMVIVRSDGIDAKSNISTYKDGNYGDDVMAIIEPR